MLAPHSSSSAFIWACADSGNMTDSRMAILRRFAIAVMVFYSWSGDVSRWYGS